MPNKKDYFYPVPKSDVNPFKSGLTPEEWNKVKELQKKQVETQRVKWYESYPKADMLNNSHDVATKTIWH